MHQMLCGIVVLDRPKGAGADVQQHIHAQHPARVETRQQVGGEMQSRRRRRDRTGLCGIHRLVPCRIRRRVGPLNVRRQRNVAVPLDCLERITAGVQFDDARMSRRGVHDLDAKVRRDGDHPSRPQLAARMNHRLIVAGIYGAQQEDFGWAAAFPLAQQAGAKHTRGVDDDGVAGRNQFRQITKGSMTERALRTIDHQQPARIPRLDRLLRDALRRERVIVVGRSAARRWHRVVDRGVHVGNHRSRERQPQTTPSATGQRIVNSVSRDVFLPLPVSVTSTLSRYVPGA